jgi:hypothetical protein
LTKKTENKDKSIGFVLELEKLILQKLNELDPSIIIEVNIPHINVTPRGFKIQSHLDIYQAIKKNTISIIILNSLIYVQM